VDNSKIREAFALLEDVRENLIDFSNITGTHIALRYFEDKYGEYFVADRMIALEWQIMKFGGKGVDIIAQKGDKIVKLEVKTSRFVRRFKGAKKGMAWTIKDTQWKNREFDKLVVVAMDFKKGPCAMLFSYEQAMDYFALASFERDDDPNHRPSNNQMILNLSKTYDDWSHNMEKAKTAINLKTEGTEFETEFNRNPGAAFAKYDFEKLSGDL